MRLVFNQNKKEEDLFMKRLLPTCLLPLAVTFTLHTGTPVILEKPDTITVHSTGINNRVVIDSLQLNESFNESVASAVKGEITQTGENNRVEINTGGEEPKNKHQITINKSQTNSKIQTTKTKQAAKYVKPETCNQEPETCNSLEQSGNPNGRNPAPAGKQITNKNQKTNSKIQNPNDKCLVTNDKCPVISSDPSAVLPNDQCPMTSDPSTDPPNDQCPMTNDKKERYSGHIKVTQTGKNNSIKINSR